MPVRKKCPGIAQSCEGRNYPRLGFTPGIAQSCEGRNYPRPGFTPRVPVSLPRVGDVRCTEVRLRETS
jgi:hypothetical protein